MIALDEDALVCDFAETYKIYDFRALPVKYAAVLACGLRSNSRIMMRIAGAKAPADTILRAAMVDRLSLLVWANTKDAQKNRNRPKSLLEELYKGAARKEIEVFESGEAFEAARRKLIGKEG